MRSGGIVLLFHGSRAPAAAAHEELLCNRVLGLGAAAHVVAAHLQPSSSLEDALASCRARGAARVVVVPMFVTPGGHAAEDVPALLEAARRRFPDLTIVASEILGAHPKTAELVAELAAAVR